MTMTTEPILKVENLTIDVPMAQGTLHAVRGIDFELRRGETLCIVGESGSGKDRAVERVLHLRSVRLIAHHIDTKSAGVDHHHEDREAENDERAILIAPETAPASSDTSVHTYPIAFESFSHRPNSRVKPSYPRPITDFPIALRYTKRGRNRAANR